MWKCPWCGRAFRFGLPLNFSQDGGSRVCPSCGKRMRLSKKGQLWILLVLLPYPAVWPAVHLPWFQFSWALGGATALSLFGFIMLMRSTHLEKPDGT